MKAIQLMAPGGLDNLNVADIDKLIDNVLLCRVQVHTQLIGVAVFDDLEIPDRLLELNWNL